MPERPSLRILAAVGLVSGATLSLQVVLTRLLSSVMAYHFSFLAISLALLGTGGGALLVYLVPRWFEHESLERLLARWSVIFGVLLLLVPFLLVHLNFTDRDGVNFRFVVNLAAACALATLPALAAGVVIALAISGYPGFVGRVYAFDLVGAAFGAIVVVPMLWLVDAPALLSGLGLVVLAAALLFGAADRRERVIAGGLVAAGAVLFVIATSTSLLYLAPRFNIPTDAVKVSDRWNPLSRVIAYDFPSVDGFAAVFYDRDYAPVPKVQGDEIPDWQDLGTGTQSVGYSLIEPGKVLIIGGGGGRDIYNALSQGQKQVDVIELNDGIRKAVDEDLAELSGSPYSRPKVNTSIGDGRSVLAARDTQYDMIHIGFTNTLTASSAAGYVLAENNLYTLEAFDEYFDHLQPGGVLNISRIRRFAGDEAVRATVLMLASLERQGVEHPERNTIVMLGRDILGEEYGTIVARLKPFTSEEVEEVRQLAEERGEGVIFAPGGPYVDEWEDLHESSGWRSFCEDYRLNVCPTSDDKPFFFNMTRISDLGSESSSYSYARDPFEILMLTLGILLVLSFLAFFLPLKLSKRAERTSVGSVSYFAAIGLGFLLLETVLIQRFVLFLGFPTYALSVVLFSLLLFTGAGSALSSRFASSRRALMVALGVIVGITAIGSYGLQPLLRSMISMPFAVRVVVAVIVLAPLGVVLGMAMPIGLARFQRLYPSSVPYAWGVNGVASVLASVLGVALAINFGFAVTSLVALVCYLGALAHAAFGRWPDDDDPTLSPRAAEPELVGSG